MAGDVEPDYLASPDDAAASVLYVDGDTATMAALTDYVEEERAPVEVACVTDPAAAVDAVRAGAWGCLVVGGDLPRPERRAVTVAAECPVVSFTSAGRAAESDPVVAASDLVIEKGTDERILAMLVRKVQQFAEAGSEDADTLAGALARVSDDDATETACFLVEDGELVWASRPFESVFPAAASGDDGGNYDERLAALFGTVPDETEDLLTVDAPGTDPDAADRGDRIGDTRYYRHARHRLPDQASGRRLDVFEDVTDRVAREANSRMHELLVEQARDGLFVFDADGVLVFCNDAFASMLDYDPGALVGKHAAEIFAEGELHAAQRDVQNLLDAGATGSEGNRTFVDSDGDPVPVSVNYTVLAGDETAFDGFVCVARDVTERRCREAELEARRDQLARINRADALVQDVVRELGRASTREELEAAVCDRLHDAEGVTMAWIGKREGASDRIVPGTVAGEPQEYLREVVATTSAEDAANGPVLRAVQSGSVQMVDDVREDEMVAPWCDLALSYDLYSLAMIPLTHGETVHGVLAVYGDRPNAFTDALTERFSLLGDTIGFAMTAVQNKRLIEQDVTVELEFRSDSEDACLVWLARARDCRLETVGAVDLGEDVLQYLRVDGASPDAVAEAALASDEVRGTRVVRGDGADGGVVELRTPSSLQTTLSEVGASLVEAVVRTTGTRVVVEAPSDGDVRAIHEAVRRSNPNAELVTKTEGSRTETGASDERAIADALTDRQREVLQAAFLAGYYAWPRDTTAEELADSLDIASPTLHQHLRRAERNILTALFEE